MGVRDRLDRIAAWFGFGVDEDDYYEDEEEEDRRHVNDAYANGSRAGGEPGPTGRRPGRPARGPPAAASGSRAGAEPGPRVRGLGRSERSSAFGTSLGDLFGSEGPRGGADRYAGQNQPSHLRPVPDPRPTRAGVGGPAGA